MAFLALLISIYALYQINQLRNEIDQLKFSHNLKQPIKEKNDTKQELTQEKEITYTYNKSEPSIFTNFLNWFAEDWLLKLGIFILLIGFGWFISYAFLNNWIGPVGRVTLGFIAGTVVSVFGWHRIKKFLHQGSAFLVFGSTLILVTVYGGYHAYGFFSHPVALFIMLLSTSFISLASVKYKNKNLALANILLAGFAPILVDLPFANYIGLFSYLLVVVLGAIWIAGLVGFRELITASLFVVFLYSLPVFGLGSATRSSLLVFGYVFTTVFFISNLLAIVKSRNKKPNTYDLLTGAGTGLFLLLWVSFAAPSHWQSVILVSWALVFMFGAYTVFSLTKIKKYFYNFASVGIVLIAAATAAELNGSALTIAYITEATILTILSYMFFKNAHLTEKVSLTFIVPILMSLENVFGYSLRQGLFHDDFYVVFTMTVALIFVALYFYSLNESRLNYLIKLFGVAGSLYLYVLIWNVLGSTFPSKNTATMLSLLVFALIGLYTHFMGLFRSRPFFTTYGTFLLGFVTFRLLFIDVWRMDLTGRVITFFLIGSLFVSTAFIRTKKVNNGELNEKS